MATLEDFDVALVRAGNPGPFTLAGTNTWVVGRDPCWVVDPGPALDAHVVAVRAEVARRGGLASAVLTHDHADHSGAVAAFGGAPALRDGDAVGPLTAIATPGHAPDHLAFAFGRVCFTGDAVLGEGSVFVAPDPGALRGYLTALERLRAMGFALLCPGHGPVVDDPEAKLGAYLAHRLDRERRLVAALGRGLRAQDELLDAVWDDAPAALRPAAAVTLAAHLDKLEEEGRLPPEVERLSGWPPPA